MKRLTFYQVPCRLLQTGCDLLSFFLSFYKACPLNAWPVSGAERTSQEIWESFSQCFTPAVKEVVEFAKGIPGFQELSQQDQVMLLKSGTFQVLRRASQVQFAHH